MNIILLLFMSISPTTFYEYKEPTRKLCVDEEIRPAAYVIMPDMCPLEYPYPPLWYMPKEEPKYKAIHYK